MRAFPIGNRRAFSVFVKLGAKLKPEVLCRSSCRHKKRAARRESRAPRDFRPSSAHRARERSRRRPANGDAPRKWHMNYPQSRQRCSTRLAVAGTPDESAPSQSSARTEGRWPRASRLCASSLCGDGISLRWVTSNSTRRFKLPCSASRIKRSSLTQRGTNRPMEMLQRRLVAPIHHLGQHAGFEVALNLLANRKVLFDNPDQQIHRLFPFRIFRV
jgi:hypothetical protein